MTRVQPLIYALVLCIRPWIISSEGRSYGAWLIEVFIHLRSRFDSPAIRCRMLGAFGSFLFRVTKKNYGDTVCHKTRGLRIKVF